MQPRQPRAADPGRRPPTRRVGSGENSLVAAAGGPDIDRTRRAMHTTGTVGPHDDKIVVVLTLEPVGTTW